MQIALGTTSEDKRRIVEKVLKELGIRGVIEQFSVNSEVTEQPLSEKETIKGASNRSRKALKNLPEAEIGLGLEGGLCKINNFWYLVCATVIVDKLGNEYVGVGSKLALPEEVGVKIEEGFQFGQVIREFIPEEDDKNINKIISLLITRKKSFFQATENAYLIFLSSNFY